MFSQVDRDVPRPEIIEIAGLAAADDSDRFPFEEIRLRVDDCTTTQDRDD
jgi:hypothetical protein